MEGFETVAKRYATAVFSLANDASAVEAVGKDLHAVATALDSSAEVKRFFLSPVVDRAEKTRLLASIFEGKVGDTVLNTLLLLVKKRREPLLGPIVKAFDDLVLAASGRETLDIVSARPLSTADLDGIVAGLSSRYGKAFKVKTSVDPSLLGGVRISMGDRLIDGSLSGRIDDLARELLATTV